MFGPTAEPGQSTSEQRRWVRKKWDNEFIVHPAQGSDKSEWISTGLEDHNYCVRIPSQRTALPLQEDLAEHLSCRALIPAQQREQCSGEYACEMTHKINESWGDDTVTERSAKKWSAKFEAGENRLKEQSRLGTHYPPNLLRAKKEQDLLINYQKACQRYSPYANVDVLKIDKRYKPVQALAKDLYRFHYSGAHIHGFFRTVIDTRVSPCHENFSLYSFYARVGNGYGHVPVVKRGRKPIQRPPPDYAKQQRIEHRVAVLQSLEAGETLSSNQRSFLCRVPAGPSKTLISERSAAVSEMNMTAKRSKKQKSDTTTQPKAKAKSQYVLHRGDHGKCSRCGDDKTTTTSARC
ncbi:hypothetical protein KIN20_004145 [Parelaphostrongylus tenuis]|uniref:Uncharacterized protein n=1 Tax=Parelaphostrongylus tenuis TaxID=148309 RepID=A0AAD5M1A3_PARTN|nr:hypothetical protein KIN20_004145 [Parelaphostrongylus tenuis]